MIGIDLSKEMLNIAMEKKERSGSKRPLSVPGYADAGFIQYGRNGGKRL